MKLGIITDTHFGARSDNLALLDYQKKFLDDVFFPTLDKHNITEVCHLGDLVDRRKYINIQTAHRMRTEFISPLLKSGRKLHIIPGNHDVYYKNSNYVNSLEELLHGMNGINIYFTPTDINFDSVSIMFLPWITEDNHELCMKAVNDTKSQVLFGHLQLLGFEMERGRFSDSGFESSLFHKFDLVCSGHFHHRSVYNNINYLGNPFEMTWADYDDPKGFHIYDTKTRSLQFIRNPYRLFQKINYSDEGKTVNDVLNVNFKQFANSYVKVIVQSKTNAYLFDLFIQKIEKEGAIDVKAIDDHLNLALDLDGDIINEAESTLDILTKTVKQTDVPEDYQVDLENLLRDLYGEANILQS